MQIKQNGISRAEFISSMQSPRGAEIWNMDRKVRAEKSQLQAEIYQQTPKDMVVEMFNSNAIDSELKRTVLLKEALSEFVIPLLALASFSAVFNSVPLEGTDKIGIPFYPLQ